MFGVNRNTHPYTRKPVSFFYRQSEGGGGNTVSQLGSLLKMIQVTCAPPDLIGNGIASISDIKTYFPR